jgi:CubicO group peptidase (beta-lactamase class C family)
MENRRRVSTIFKNMLCLMIFVLMTNQLWFTKAAGEEKNMFSNRNIEDFKKKMDEKIPKWQEDYGVLGVAIGIVHEGDIAYTLNYGYADKKTKKPVSDDTLFQAGSISKSLTAWGIMHLVDEGRLSLDDPVGEFLKE